MKQWLPAACLGISLVSLSAFAGGPDNMSSNPFDTPNYVYAGVGVGPSFSSWNSSFGSSFKNAFNIGNISGEPNLSDQTTFATRLSLGINFLNHYGFEGAFTEYSPFSWDGAATQVGGAQGRLSVKMGQRSWDLFGKYFFTFHRDFTFSVLLGTSYVQDRGARVVDHAGYISNEYNNQSYWTFAYGAGLEYNIPAFRRMSVTFKYIGYLARDGQKFTNIPDQVANRNFKVNIPMRGTILFGINYHILYM
jgi:hypothetical protein